MAEKGELWEAHSIVGMTRHQGKKGGVRGPWERNRIVGEAEPCEGDEEDKGWWE